MPVPRKKTKPSERIFLNIRMRTYKTKDGKRKKRPLIKQVKKKGYIISQKVLILELAYKELS